MRFSSLTLPKKSRNCGVWSTSFVVVSNYNLSTFELGRAKQHLASYVPREQSESKPKCKLHYILSYNIASTPLISTLHSILLRSLCMLHRSSKNL